jgi:hypothetical protein
MLLQSHEHKLLISFYCLIFALYTLSVIVQDSLTSLYSGKHESIIDILRPQWLLGSVKFVIFEIVGRLSMYA